MDDEVWPEGEELTSRAPTQETLRKPQRTGVRNMMIPRKGRAGPALPPAAV
jgi:hypothetical protein